MFLVDSDDDPDYDQEHISGLTLWGYSLTLCLDEDKDVRCGLFHEMYCQEKNLTMTVLAFVTKEKDNTIKLCALIGWLFGRIRFNAGCSDSLYEVNETPLSKDELDSCYEEATLSKVLGMFFKEEFAKNNVDIFTPVQNAVKNWMAHYCDYPEINGIDNLNDLFNMFVLKQCQTEKAEKYCDFLKHGFKIMKLFDLKFKNSEIYKICDASVKNIASFKSS